MEKSTQNGIETIVLTADDKYDVKELMGTWIDSRHYDYLIDRDTDVYLKNRSLDGSFSMKPMLKFRKGYFEQKHVDSAYEGLRMAARKTANRGQAAGTRVAGDDPMKSRTWVSAAQLKVMDAIADLRPSLLGGDQLGALIDQYFRDKSTLTTSNKGFMWKKNSLIETGFVFDDWIEKARGADWDKVKRDVIWIRNELISDTSSANLVDSGIAGWFGRYPRVPWGRATGYTRDHFDKFKLSYPYLQHLADAFKEFIPEQYEAQMNLVKRLDPRFYVPGTPFTTITVNHNFRTSAHLDAANAEVGFSNVCSFSNNDCYEGCELILPEWRVAVNSRPRDLFLVDNQGIVHGNGPLRCYADKNGVMGERVSIVAYFRQDMLQLGSVEYEELRHAYVDQCKADKMSWNGVWLGMWESESWKQFALPRMDRATLVKHQPQLFTEHAVLDSLFG